MEADKITLETAIRDAQNLLLAKVERRVGPLPEPLVRAFRDYPRHAFVERYRESGQHSWQHVNRRNLRQHIPVIYRDQPLIIWGESRAVSTISQPSFVLYLLTLLEIKSGERIFELGAGSGWNAALMGTLALPGEVYSYEIVPELARSAANRIQKAGLENVHVICGDGMDVPTGLQFDRGIFTAGAIDLPQVFFEMIRGQGRLLFVFQNPGGSDLLLVLDRKGEGFVSRQIIECGFVPVTGKMEHKKHSIDESMRSLKEVKNVRIVPAGAKVELGGEELLMSREHSQFIWSF